MIKIKRSKKEGFLKPFHFADVERRKKQRKFFVVLVVIFILLLVIKGLWFSPISDAKAIERTEKNIQSGAYCSGYHNNKADGSRIVVFRSNQTHEIVDEFEVSWEIAEKIYNEEV